MKCQNLPFDNAKHRSAVVTLYKEVFNYATAHNAPAFSIDKKLQVDDGLFFVAEMDSGEVPGAVMG